jgi:tetratricopeptide (TPR) repeat protein
VLFSKRKKKLITEAFRDSYDYAVVHFYSTIDIDPDNAFALADRGLNFFCCGLYDQALADYDRAISPSPTRAELYYHRALACERAVRKDDAVRSYMDFLRFASDKYLPYARHVEERLRKLRDPLD